MKIAFTDAGIARRAAVERKSRQALNEFERRYEQPEPSLVCEVLQK